MLSREKSFIIIFYSSCTALPFINNMPAHDRSLFKIYFVSVLAYYLLLMKSLYFQYLYKEVRNGCRALFSLYFEARHLFPHIFYKEKRRAVSPKLWLVNSFLQTMSCLSLSMVCEIPSNGLSVYGLLLLN